MAADLGQAFVVGVERVTAWSSLLDRINVFPVADGDTGRNLVISLTPLRRFGTDPESTLRELLFSARGNAGNIAARFFQALIRKDALGRLPELIRKGSDQARRAVGDPQPGTMLTFFEGLTDAVHQVSTWERAHVEAIMEQLVRVVRSTTARQPRLQQAGVVDAGALGMFIFFDGFLNALAGNLSAFCPIATRFEDGLRLRQDVDQIPESGYCVDMLLSQTARVDEEIALLSRSGDSVVVIRDGEYLKVHLHTTDPEKMRKDIASFHNVLRWSDDDLGAQTAAFPGRCEEAAIHVMTDAAGSLSRRQAQELGVTLLDSYITLGDRSFPESCLTPEILYEAMRKGMPVSTSQASVFERRQFYESALSLHGKVLYLCVGSVFTGNYATARRWKADSDPEDRLIVLDTGCAAGRLGLLASLTAKFTRRAGAADAVAAFVREAVSRCREYIFLDRLQYLAAGGRMSKTGAFFGDMMHMKPVISPQADGARKVGMVRSGRDQAAFALKKLGRERAADGRSPIWLEYTDNRQWVEDEVRPQVSKRYPEAEIVVIPLSLTTGVHTGPGTWGMVFYADP